MSTRRGLRSKNDSEEDNDETSAMASVVGLYQNSPRGRSDDESGEGGGTSSRSRSRSSSVLRRMLGRSSSNKETSKQTDDGRSVASGTTSLASASTKNTKIKTIKKIKKSDGSSRRSSSCDRTRSSSRDRTRSNSCDGTRSSSRDRTRSNNSLSGSVDVEDDGPSTSMLDKKLRKTNKLKYKSRRVNDSGGVDSDGDYGAADSDGDTGSIDGGRSIGSEGVLSSCRKVRRKKKPKKSNYADDDTVGSSKASLGGSVEYRKTPRMSSKDKGTHDTKIGAIPAPSMSPEGEMLKNEMDSLFPSPKSEKKKLPRVKRKGKPEISDISFEKEEFNPIVDRTPGARPSDYRKSHSRGNQDAPSKGRPPLPERSASHYSQNHDSGLSSDAIPQEMPTSNRSNKSFRSCGKGGGDNDTILSMTDTVSSANRHLDDQREETKDLQKQLTAALSKVASLNEELRLQEGTALKAEAHIAEVKAEKAELQTALVTMKNDSIAKDDRIDKLQQIVETQLDTIEFLEVQLEQTEDELFKMDDELKALDEGGLLDQSVHTKNLLKRKETIKQDKETRKGSIRVQTEESRSVLNESNKRLRSVSNADELHQREAKIKAREQKLDDWEKNLVKIDVQLRAAGLETEEETTFKVKLQLLEKRERRMEENFDALLQEKEDLLQKVLLLEKEIKDSSLANSTNAEVVAMKSKILKLENENKVLLSEIEELKRAQKNDISRIKELESDKQDLRVKLDHVRSTAIRDEEEQRLKVKSMEEEINLLRGGDFPGSSGDAKVIQKLRDDVMEKNARISSLEAKLEKAGTIDNRDDNEGKDLLIRELQNQLVAAKKEAHDLSSGDHVKRLKAEVKTLKQGYNDVKKRMKSAEISAQGALKQKHESLQAMKNDMAVLKRNLERLEKREKNLKMDGSLTVHEGDLRKHIEDLENEVDHWKATNADLETELELLKDEITSFKKSAKSSEGDFDDDDSMGSLQSMNSYMSEHQGMEMSSHSVSNGLFFVSDSTSVRRSISIAPPPPEEVEPSTPSQRALRSVSNLWSKMRNEPAHQANPAIPYGPGILNDD
ncbi:hypothetical protein IV203_035222 [Nitzschia inconspicua]|uniref:Uncharacterized protein n=1 Tax=Nitzschia inconspicua TaxID=303405 RepID=A0A9K3LEK1_9STRA|nr:hypothetical protein IV203_035222 [Nitzschia inconspicua]